jgi:methionine synthase II (cobalamin-independent)
VLETLPGKTIILGVLDLSTHEIETPGTVAERIRRAKMRNGSSGWRTGTRRSCLRLRRA